MVFGSIFYQINTIKPFLSSFQYEVIGNSPWNARSSIKVNTNIKFFVKELKLLWDYFSHQEWKINLYFSHCTGKWMQESSIPSSIKANILCWFTCFVKITNLKLSFFWFVTLTKRFYVHNLYKTHKSTKNQDQILASIDKRCIHLTVSMM